ncbi:hypothetical protein [Parageobacillus thermoglucosidasius]|uniref:hypothetical protein n=1 Tax=Parageobacillus thermoglucosidasius TaxID=1426 RepID=UPI000E11D3C2|nr:hypothetical protein [Parageobacillus thermoglucosidasius]MED4904110.1 hypothetical protein [Parageobacillus thermoglucosidasius]MED4915660.1 hypothetical protein [Parageobacillus thermoglucosidasius]MED4945075.1 hypothetical protein [Parageobacillus thermoglucosidasius]MED4983728.1 hypothetical protein [Parageobacillus thermoglucosidasius]RDE19329.1 hypothetical protein DV714_20055 [Parageobacillus thermoglucosidasius]
MNIRVARDLVEISNNDQFNGILIAPIRFESDPVTGFFMKCPHCGKISAHQFLLIHNRKVKCPTKDCTISVDTEDVKRILETRASE